MGKKKKVLSSKIKKDITDTVPMMLGLGAYESIFNNWNSIENFSKRHAIYHPMQLRELIHKHSPLAKAGDANLEIARIIDEDIAKARRPNIDAKSFHAACVDNFRELCVLIGVDPNTVHMGANWMQLQKKKDKRLQQKSFADKMYPKKYTAIIGTLQSRYTRLIESNSDAYDEWCVQNKKNRDTLTSIKKTLKFLDNKK